LKSEKKRKMLILEHWIRPQKTRQPRQCRWSFRFLNYCCLHQGNRATF